MVDKVVVVVGTMTVYIDVVVVGMVVVSEVVVVVGTEMVVVVVMVSVMGGLQCLGGMVLV